MRKNLNQKGNLKRTNMIKKWPPQKKYEAYKLFIASRGLNIKLWVLNCLRFSFVIQAKVLDKSFKVAKCVSITIVSSNINEAIRRILNFFIQKFHEHQKHKTLKSKQKGKMFLKNIYGECSHLFAYLCFMLLPECLCAF